MFNKDRNNSNNNNNNNNMSNQRQNQPQSQSQQAAQQQQQQQQSQESETKIEAEGIYVPNHEAYTKQWEAHCKIIENILKELQSGDRSAKKVKDRCNALQNPNVFKELETEKLSAVLSIVSTISDYQEVCMYMSYFFFFFVFFFLFVWCLDCVCLCAYCVWSTKSDEICCDVM